HVECGQHRLPGFVGHAGPVIDDARHRRLADLRLPGDVGHPCSHARHCTDDVLRRRECKGFQKMQVLANVPATWPTQVDQATVGCCNFFLTKTRRETYMRIRAAGVAAALTLALLAAGCGDKTDKSGTAAGPSAKAATGE